MRLVRDIALLAALLLPSGAGAAPWGRSASKVELHASVRESFRAGSAAERVFRELPAAPQPPGAYVQVTRWVEAVALPAPDGKPKLVVVAVRGGLALAWARRW
jgi:hypothetical protein